ncbi:protein Shroom3 [Syngnathoides biaculeatus]|uniref:protein Shroom3 n=1 Tax=Syngnathoides biaculeatus TaxID=300417 RepID=UPI002ADD46A9|nr:protein Shroom3 [Syngnathoides biaculeatus]XP_061659513.1 protein Shroom3 [Syngnathoides biaculeatus]XP_061659514.1 protein Shroom3 [Syngnathoides biaculeatus]XP_061659516.1 protein Shroom3 [Syngnathoides biaculeatus]XP_061659517.1 protein Shroom3 [Syngnathoides biaculeatus]XP_061659518.1 protein Shroom3 [Syngnathoides biaculeatus]
MDSYSFHFERMSNVDLHPLSLPISRLSPAKSNSSIVEQFAHHQHGKGDSAYSSFSGGSTAPDYLPSLHFPEDLQSNPFSHYADLKYIKSIYHPTQVLQSNAKTMDQLYRSMEVISQNYRNSTHNHNGNGSFHTNDKPISKVHLRAPSQGDYSPTGPPPVPARQDSFTATKNLENKSQHNTHPQQPRPHNYHHAHPHGGIVHQMGTAKPGSNTSVISPETVYSDRSGVPGAEVQQLPSYRPPAPSFEQDRMSMNPHIFITDNEAPPEHLKSVNFPRRSPPKGISQSEHLKARHPSSGGGCNGKDHGNLCDVSSEFKNPRKRAHSAYDWIGSEPAHVFSPWNGGHTGFIDSSIQHKGQFYFVTGVCNHSETRMRTHSVSLSGSEAASECSTVLERPRPKERERCHSTMENLFIPIKDVLDEKGRQTKDLIPRRPDQENHKSASFSTRSSKSWDSFEEIDTETREIGRHTTTNPIFYCGPGKNSAHSTLQTKEMPSLAITEQTNQPEQKEQAKGGKRHPLTDVGSDRINKETTPLLYHLTEANRTTMQSQKDAEFGMKDKEATPSKTCVRDVSIKNGKPIQGDVTKNETEGVSSGACNTLDDSYKKYYKEKLKDAQSKVLKETSFKRRDLQLASTHCPRPKHELRPSMIHSFSSSQDSETSTDTLTPSVTSEETERGSIVEKVRQSPKQMNTETVREHRMSAKLAQPQVATRIGGRKRLTLEQKKMYCSEPEKLNRLGHGPSHSASRSFSNESDGFLMMDSEWQDHEHPGDQGLVAARRKLFETRGRALSASSASKTNLKHLQHKALVAYMERKTGQKVPELQQPIPPRQRHSLGEKPFDWGPRPLSASTESSHLQKKLNRPQSAGRILDSSTNSIRYAQFFSAQPSTGQPKGQSNQCRWKERTCPPHSMYASVESLLDQPEPPTIFRNRSTSTPHAFQAQDDRNGQEPVNSTEACSLQKNMASARSSTPEAQQQIRKIAHRGKSVEELEAFKLTRMSALSKSSEQLDQACRDVRNVSLFAEVREAQDRERGRKKYGLNAAEKTDISDLMGQAQIDTQKKSSLKHNSDPAPLDVEDVGLNATTGRRTLSGSHSPTSCLSSRGKRQSSGSRSPPTDRFLSNKPPIEASSSTHSRGDQETIEKAPLSTFSSPTQIKQPCENRPSSRGNQSSYEQSVVEAGKDCLPPAHKVSLNCGVTTDPSLWIFPSEEEQPKEDVQRPDCVFDEPAILHLPRQMSETSVSACVSVSGQQVAIEKNSKTEDEYSRENEEIEEKCTPEGKTAITESLAQRPQWEELVEAVVKADQSLAPALYPLANRKTALMLMEQLLSEDTLLMEEHYKKKQEQKGAEQSCEPETTPSPDGLKASNSEVRSTVDITDKKSMLVCYIEERLRALEETRGVLQAEIQENVAHGEALESLVRERCLPLELERYNLFIGDLERVVNLLLCLSARLARVQNALSTVDNDTDVEEKQSLDSRHRLLCKQREDAKDLKDNLDRRESLVSTFLSRQLSAEQVRDYRRFVQTKASLLIRRKDLEEKTRLGEEQLDAIAKSLRV